MDCGVVKHTSIPGYPRRQGKVRDIYDVGDKLVIVATDRISAFDVVLTEPIPCKGLVLNQLASFWFNMVGDKFPHHLLSTNIDDFPGGFREYRDVLQGRSMLVAKAKPLPVECIVRGYLAGSAFREYAKTGEVWGIRLPKGLKKGDKLPEPVFTPTTKAEEGHDKPLMFSELEDLVGGELARSLKDKSIALYSFAADYAFQRGIIIADTKFEFGFLDDKLVLIDEIFTPDSSRFWLASDYVPGCAPDGLDKQFVRDFLETCKWDKTPPPPTLPEEVIKGTQDRYLEVFHLITGRGISL